MFFKDVLLRKQNQIGEGEGDGQSQQNNNDQNNTNQNDSNAANKNDPSKTVGSLKFYKEQLEAERKEREKIAKELELVKTGQLKEKENWKQLYENELTERQKIEEKLKTVSTNVIENLKIKEIEKEAIANGILPEALEDLSLVDSSMIEVETTSTGRINFNNVKEFIESLKIKKPYLFTKKGPPTINNNQPNNNYAPKEYSASEILKLQKENPTEYNKVMRKKLGLA